jgi:hypothetical protein
MCIDADESDVSALSSLRWLEKSPNIEMVQGGMTGTESAPATNVDAIFRSLQLTSLKNKANQASGARLPLMENSGDGISDGTLPADTGESNDVSSSASPPASDAHADSSMVATDLTGTATLLSRGTSGGENRAKVDSPQIGHPPDPGKPAALRICPISGPHAMWQRVRRRKNP